jgi:hypothetical protein
VRWVDGADFGGRRPWVFFPASRLTSCLYRVADVFVLGLHHSKAPSSFSVLPQTTGCLSFLARFQPTSQSSHPPRLATLAKPPLLYIASHFVPRLFHQARVSYSNLIRPFFICVESTPAYDSFWESYDSFPCPAGRTGELGGRTPKLSCCPREMKARGNTNIEFRRNFSALEGAGQLATGKVSSR